MAPTEKDLHEARLFLKEIAASTKAITANIPIGTTKAVMVISYNDLILACKDANSKGYILVAPPEPKPGDKGRIVWSAGEGIEYWKWYPDGENVT